MGPSKSCDTCDGYCDLYQTIWDSGFERSDCDWISGCFLVKFALPRIISEVGNSYIGNLQSNESLTDWWYNITNYSVSLMEPLNYHQTLYYIGPYIKLHCLLF